MRIFSGFLGLLALEYVIFLPWPPFFPDVMYNYSSFYIICFILLFSNLFCCFLFSHFLITCVGRSSCFLSYQNSLTLGTWLMIINPHGDSLFLWTFSFSCSFWTFWFSSVLCTNISHTFLLLLLMVYPSLLTIYPFFILFIFHIDNLLTFSSVNTLDLDILIPNL